MMRQEIKWFAEQMEKRMAENDEEKGDSWLDMDIYDIEVRMHQELQEIVDAIVSYDDVNVSTREHLVKELADLSNFCMMMANIVR